MCIHGHERQEHTQPLTPPPPKHTLLAAGTSWMRVRRVAVEKSAGCGTSCSHALHALLKAGGGKVFCRLMPRVHVLVLGRR